MGLVVDVKFIAVRFFCVLGGVLYLVTYSFLEFGCDVIGFWDWERLFFSTLYGFGLVLVAGVGWGNPMVEVVAFGLLNGATGHTGVRGIFLAPSFIGWVGGYIGGFAYGEA